MLRLRLTADELVAKKRGNGKQKVRRGSAMAFSLSQDMDERASNMARLQSDIDELEMSTKYQLHEGDDGESDKAITAAIGWGAKSSSPSAGADPMSALNQALKKIADLDSKLTLAEAKIAVGAMGTKSGHSNHDSAAEYDDLSDGEREDQELIELRRRVKELEAQLGAKDQRLSELSATGKDIVNIMSEGTEGREKLNHYFTSPPSLSRKVVIMPFFFGSKSRSDDDDGGEQRSGHKHHGRSKKSNERKYGDNNDSESESDSNSDDADDSDEDSHTGDDDNAIDDEGGGKMKKRRAQASEEQTNERREKKKRNKNMRTRALLKFAAKEGHDSHRHASSWTKLKAISHAVAPRKRHHTGPLSSSPLSKYTTWAPRDRKTLLSVEKVLHISYRMIEKKAIQEDIKEANGRTNLELLSLAEFVEIYFMREFGECLQRGVFFMYVPCAHACLLGVAPAVPYRAQGTWPSTSFACTCTPSINTRTRATAGRNSWRC